MEELRSVQGPVEGGETAASAGALRCRWAPVLATAEVWEPRASAVVIVVPHPDDEALLFGGLVQRLGRRDTALHVIAATDGESAYPGDDPDRLRAVRVEEQNRALNALGVDLRDVSRLSLPDGGVAAHEAELRSAITRAVVESGATLLLAPWLHDHHPDHEACGRATRDVADRHGLDLAFGLFWTWHAGSPDDLAEQRLLAVPLDETMGTARREALGHHRSQFLADDDPVLDDSLVEPVWWSREFYVAVDVNRPRPVGPPGAFGRPVAGAVR